MYGYLSVESDNENRCGSVLLQTWRIPNSWVLSEELVSNINSPEKLVQASTQTFVC